jgi:hypothetical protein
MVPLDDWTEHECEEDDPEPGDGCLCCGSTGPCGCDARFEDSRDD